MSYPHLGTRGDIPTSTADPRPLTYSTQPQLPTYSENPPGSPMPDTAIGGPVHADFISMHSSSINLRTQWQTLTATRRRHVHTRQDDQDESNSGWMNESGKNPKTNTISNYASHTKTDTKLAPDFEKDSDSSSIVDAASSSDDESSDDEFGSADNPKMSPQNRAELEEAIFGNKLNTTAKYKKRVGNCKGKRRPRISAESYLEICVGYGRRRSESSDIFWRCRCHGHPHWQPLVVPCSGNAD